MSKSILQSRRECLITGAVGIYLDKHHIFNGANRKRSEELGLWVYLRPDWHNCSSYSVHYDAQLNRVLKKWAQRKCMEYYGWDVDDFIREFGKNYLLEDADWEACPPCFEFAEVM